MITRVVLIALGLLQTEAFWFLPGKCYEPYGCFDNKKPYDNAWSLMPVGPGDQNIGFLLYTNKNPTSEQILTDRDLKRVRASNFNPARSTKIITHGFTDNGRTSWIKDMTAEFLAKEDCNVIAVDWSNGAKIYWYSVYNQASANTRVVGAVIAEMVKTLVKAGASLHDVHIIGHSLGSHVAGYAGERLPGLGRITGLDPAGPNFEYKDYRVRLDPTDADFVDVIHSDAETLVSLAFGMKTPVGDVDFYPAGGYDQPGCPQHMGDHFFGDFTDVSSSVACSHSRAIKFFTASINGPCDFKAYPCSSELDDMKKCSADSCGSGCSNMGYYAKPNPSGTFYVPVTESEPYCCRYFLCGHDTYRKKERTK